MQESVGYDDQFSPHLEVIKSYHIKPICAVDLYQSDGVDRYENLIAGWLPDVLMFAFKYA